MGSSFIPSWIPATGPISIRSSSRSKRSSNSPLRFELPNSTFGVRCSAFGVCSLQKLSVVDRLTRHPLNAQRSTLNAQRSILLLRVGRWTLSVKCPSGSDRWALLPFRRVKGAWWPSRSSKPSSVGNGRDRFDSYPLRHFMFDGRCLMFDFKATASRPHRPSSLKHQTSERGGERDAPRAIT